MRNILKYIAICLGTLMWLSSCSEENVHYIITSEGEDVVLQLSYQEQLNKEIVVSRATDPENRLDDLHFYVFNSAGKLTGYKKLENATTPGPEYVSIKTVTGSAYIYALANLNNKGIYYLNDEDRESLMIDEKNIDEATLTRDEFLNITFNRQYGDASHIISPNPTGQFLMSGYVNKGEPITITASGDGTATIAENDKVVKLYRVLAKNEFLIEAGSGISFTPKTYELHNIAIGGKMINVGQDVTVAEVESSYTALATDKISFYLPENIRTYTGQEISIWKEREKNSYEGGSKRFVNAPQYSSYIVINGDYKNGDITASVSYTIHFGNFGHKGSLKDFNILRNYSYRYKIKINGINDIKVEAQTDKGEDNPYVEGLVIDVKSGKSYDLDAHYEARVLTFTQGDIKALKDAGKGYILRIATPFGSTDNLYVKEDGVYSAENDDKLASFDGDDVRIESGKRLFSGEDDYRWLRFVRNVKKNRISGNDLKKVAKYPGDENQKAGEYGEPWINVFAMLKTLYENADNNNGIFSNGIVYYTCFVDENFYVGKKWTAYANQKPRTVLIANELDVSTDEKSLYAKVAYSISQRSITTFYHTGFSGYPYGTENITEEELSTAYYLDKNNFGRHEQPSDETAADTEFKARTSALASNEGEYWYPLQNMNTDTDGRQPMYKQVVRACMSRNRDLNGNSKIDADEIKWYLASADQYRGLWYGEGAINSIDPDARLFRTNIKFLKDDDVENAKYHYFTSSSGANSIFWAEEGLSTSDKKSSENWQHANLVRCVRTLSSTADEGKRDADKYYNYSSNQFTLTGLTATKGRTETLNVHKERDVENGLFTTIKVAKQYLMQEMVSSDNYGNSEKYFIYNSSRPGDDNDPCNKYYYENRWHSDKGTWRMPNQKELGLMAANGLLESGLYTICRTDYSGSKANGGYRASQGFWYTGTNITINEADKELYFRCVKDVENKN